MYIHVLFNAGSMNVQCELSCPHVMGVHTVTNRTRTQGEFKNRIQATFCQFLPWRI